MPGEVTVRTVELCGLPGAGKSLIAGTLAEHLAGRGVQVSQPLTVVAPTRPAALRIGAKILVAGREVARAPAGAARALAAVRRSNQSTRDGLHRSLNWLVVRGLYRRARSRPGIHIFDQGVVQELCSIGYRGGDWRTVLAVAGPGTSGLGPDLLVRVAAPLGTVAARLGARPGRQSRLERADAADRRAELDHLDRTLREIERAWLDRHGGVLGTRRAEVRNDDGPIDATLAVLADHVVRMPPAGEPLGRQERGG